MHICVTRAQYINSSPLGQNGCHFADNIIKSIMLNENVWISIKISLKFVPNGTINNILALVQIMTWHRPGDKPLSEPMMVNLQALSKPVLGGLASPTDMEMINSLRPSDAYMPW